MLPDQGCDGEPTAVPTKEQKSKLSEMKKEKEQKEMWEDVFTILLRTRHGYFNYDYAIAVQQIKEKNYFIKQQKK